MNKTNAIAKKIINKGLADLGIIASEKTRHPYFPHGTSHHMGLDTHDYGILTEPMEANMVFTVEPGIYIPEENLGIRLEDDYVIQASGEPINLMKNIPIEIDDIEKWMAG